MACRKCFSNEFPWQTSRPHIKYKSLTPFNSVLCQAFHTSERLHSYDLPHRTYAPLPITHSPSGNHFCKLFSISTHSRRVERETFSSFRGTHSHTVTQANPSHVLGAEYKWLSWATWLDLSVRRQNKWRSPQSHRETIYKLGGKQSRDPG